MRQVVLDTETRGLDAASGHRVIEIGCIELMHRRYSDQSFHQYINPERSVDPGALAVHGIEESFLKTQPVFADVADAFIAFVEGAELVIHNAEFDIGFINSELERLGGRVTDIRDVCTVRDTLSLARRMHPGQRNSLDALARRYDVDNSMRELHGALLDASILAEVYLAMTGGQVALSLDAEPQNEGGARQVAAAAVDRADLDLVVIAANDEELDAHDAMLERMRSDSGRVPLWDELLGAAADNHTKSP